MVAVARRAAGEHDVRDQVAAPAALVRLRYLITVLAIATTVAVELVGLWNLGGPWRSLDLARRSNSATWLVACLFGVAGLMALLTWVFDDDRPRTRPGRWVWLASAAALTWLSLDAVAGLQAWELPRVINHAVNVVHPLGSNVIDGDEIPPVTSPLSALVALCLAAPLLRLRRWPAARWLVLAGLGAFAGAALLEWKRLLDYPEAAPPSRELAVAIDFARLAGGTLLMWSAVVRLRRLLDTSGRDA